MFGKKLKYNFLRKWQIWPQSLKLSTAATMVRGPNNSKNSYKTTTQLAVGGPKTFWEDQRAGGLKKGRWGQNFRFWLSAVGGSKTIWRTGNMAWRGVYETRPKFWKNLNVGGKSKCGGFSNSNFVKILEKIQKFRGNKFLLQHLVAKKGIGRGTYIFSIMGYKVY